MTGSLTAAGADQLAAGLHQVAADMAAGMADVNAAVARAIAAAVTPPVLTGALARSVRPVSDAQTASVTAGGPTVRYAGVQEHGWPRHSIRARRYLQAALESTQPQQVDLIAAGIQARLDNVKGA